jgi:rare lipoprotein A
MKRVIFIASLLSVLSACTTVSDLIPTSISSSDSGDSAPQENKDITQIVDAHPKPVIRTRAGNKSPYTVLGKTYTLLPSSEGYQERGKASWYGTKFHGRRTANGEVYDMWAMTAAHKTLPIPSYVRVTNEANGRSVVVLVNDRGPFHSQRIIDLSYAAALKLDFADLGVADVDVVDITPPEQSAMTPQEEEVGVMPSLPVTTVIKTPAKNIPNTPVNHHQSAPIYLQAAAFKSPVNAQQLQKKLQVVSTSPVIVVPSSDRQWHRVRVGPLVGVQKVSEARQVLSEHGIKKPQVVKIP